MKTIRQLTSLLVVLCVVGLYSCSKEEYLKSESGIKKQLNGSWSLVPIPRTRPDQNWAFDDNNKLTRSESGTDYVCDYSVSTSLTKAKIKLENLQIPSGTFDYNGTWEIVRLDNDYLIIANDRDGTSGITELEFVKKK